MNLKTIILTLIISINLSSITVINAMSTEEILKNWKSELDRLDKEMEKSKKEEEMRKARLEESERKMKESAAALQEAIKRVEALEAKMGIKHGKWAHPVQKQQEQSDCCIIS